MLDMLTDIENRFEEVSLRLFDAPGDPQQVKELGRELARLEPVVEKTRQYRRALSDRDQARVLLENETDPELLELAKAEMSSLEALIPALEQDIRLLLAPRNARDSRDVILEIRAGAGGDEAALFAADLFRMYQRYAEQRGWGCEVLSAHEIGLKGYREIIVQLHGQGAYSRLKFESGVHRVQRVPETEAQGRIHTSTVTVAVLAEVDAVEIDIPTDDLAFEVFRSNGAGGQNVQKNSTAVRLTHLPTGMVVVCQDERSQLKNKQRALSILRARLYEMEENRRHAEQAQERLSQVGSGDRSEKIRTYNYPQNRVTDHRVNCSSYNLPWVMDGDIDLFIDAVAGQAQAQLLSAGAA